MKQKINIFLYLALIFTQISIISNQYNENGSPMDDIPKREFDLPQKIRQDNYCDRKIKFYEIIDMNITDQDYQRKIRQHNIVVVFANLEHCKVCCQHELFFYDLVLNYLKNEQVHPYVLYSYFAINCQAKDISIAKYNLLEGNEFITEFKLYKFPSLIIFNKFIQRDSKGTVYNDIWDPVRIIRFIRRINTPVTLPFTLNKLQITYLKKVEDVDKFLNTNAVDSTGSMIQTLKVLGIFFGGEVEDKLKQFKYTSNLLLSKGEVETAYIKNAKEIKKLYQKYGTQFFKSSYELTNIVIQYFPRQYIMHDLFKETAFRESVQALQALRLVDELTNENWESYKLKNKPVLLFILDTYLQYNESMHLFKLAEQVAQKYYNQMSFCWVEGEAIPWKKELIGYMYQKVPGMMILKMDYSNRIVYPEGWPINEFTISSFIQNYLEKSISENMQEINSHQYFIKEIV